jgi:hypothetical protein
MLKETISYKCQLYTFNKYFIKHGEIFMTKEKV